MKILLKIENNEINVICRMTLESTELNFKLAKSLKIEKILFNEEEIFNYKSYSITEDFLPDLVKYEINLPEVGNIEIHYGGDLDGQLFYMENSVIHFSFYNAWYPIIDNYFNYEVFVEGHNHPWDLVQGVYDEKKQSWSYKARKTTDNFHDVNILFVNQKDYSIYKSKGVEFYYKHQYQDLMQDYISVYNELKEFYIDLYGKNKLEKTTIVYLPENEKWLGDGYKRVNLVVSTGRPSNIEDQIALIAHELGHAYGNGADCNSFEDWINETNAEWSALLFLEKNYPNLFEKRIESHKKRTNGQALNLKADEENRPKNVHSVGTMIYYDIYQKYGLEEIKDLLIICDNLKEKNTQNFLNKLISLNKQYLAEELKKHL